MVLSGQDEWDMGLDLPEGILQVQCHVVSGGSADLFRSDTIVLTRTRGT